MRPNLLYRDQTDVGLPPCVDDRATPAPRAALVGLVALAAALVLAGCGGKATLDPDDRPTSRPVSDLGTGYFDPRVEAFVVPPTAWELDPPKVDDDRTHLTWLSPDGDTAYGVVYFQVPGFVALLPKNEFTHDRATDGYIEAFREDTGDAELLSKQWDPEERGMRTVAEGGPYKVRSILRIRGSDGWSVYAGTLRDQPVDERELAIARRAREATRVGLEAEGGGDAAEAALTESGDD